MLRNKRNGHTNDATIDTENAMEVEEAEESTLPTNHNNFTTNNNPSSHDDSGRLAIQLDKICRLLKISSDMIEANNQQDVIIIIERQIHTLLSTHPYAEQLRSLERLLPSTIILQEYQKQQLQSLEQWYYQDFSVRRQLMLTRFQVTLESLLGCGEEEQLQQLQQQQQDLEMKEEEDTTPIVQEDETSRIRSAVKAQLLAIKPTPHMYQVILIIIIIIVIIFYIILLVGRCIRSTKSYFL
jgi:hypothetical protein